ISMAAEMIVPTAVFDELGVPALPEDVCLRYEIELRHDNGIRLVRERLRTLGGSLTDHVRFPHPPGYAELYGNYPTPRPAARLIYDIERGELPGSQPPGFDPAKARKTVLSQYTTADH